MLARYFELRVLLSAGDEDLADILPHTRSPPQAEDAQGAAIGSKVSNTEASVR